MDFAGSSVVHLTGAVGALAALLLLGPRIGKYGADGKPRAIPGHSMPLVGLGVAILWVGWYGFNAGSTFGTDGQLHRRGRAEHPARRRGRRRRRVRCHLREDEVARRRHGRQRRDRRTGRDHRPVRVRRVLGGADHRPRRRRDRRLRRLAIDKHLDDPVGALSAHGLAGIWGTLAVGLFASEPPDPRRRRARRLVRDLRRCRARRDASVSSPSRRSASRRRSRSCSSLSYATFFAIKKTIGLRVSEDEEQAGLDISSHGMYGYPEPFIPPEEYPGGRTASAPDARGDRRRPAPRR